MSVNYSKIVDEEIDTLHVVPLDDYEEHDTENTCWCQPYRDEDVCNVIIHNRAKDHPQ